MSDDPGWKPEPLAEPQTVSTWGLIKAILKALAAWWRGRDVEKTRAQARRNIETLDREREQDEQLQKDLQKVDDLSGPALDAELERVLRVSDKPETGPGTDT